MNNIASKISKVLLFLFSITLALGTWNPLVPFQYEMEGQNGYDLSQIVSVLFIASLLFSPNVHLNKKNKVLIISGLFFLSVLLSTIINGASLMTASTMVFFVKFVLVLLFCHLLSQLFTLSPRLIYLSAFIFSITCVILSFGYSYGFLDQFLLVSKGRVFFWGENPNSTSARYGLAFLFILHFIIRNPLGFPKWRHLLWFALPAIMNLIMATGSRGSFLILLVSVLIYLAYVPFRSKGYKLLLAFIFPVALYFFIDYIARTNQEYSLFERLSESVEEGEDAGREKLNEEAIQIFLDNPLYGIGVQNFQDEMILRFNENRTVHNLYLYVLAISGIIGFTCFMWFLYYLVKSSYAIRRFSSFPLTLFLYIFLLAYKTGGILTYMLMWYVFSIIIALSFIYKSDRREQTI